MNIPPPRETGFTNSTPLPLYWSRYGKPGGRPLLVLHGGPGAEHDYLLPQMLALESPERELVFYDQRGGGKSRTDDRTPITWQTQVADMALLIAELQLAPPDGLTVVGYSWGGLLAMLYAIEAAAGRVAASPSRLVLVDPAPVTRAFRDQFEMEFAARQAGPVVRGLRDELAGSGLKEADPDAFRQRSFELSVAGYFADPRRAHDLTPFRVVGRVQQSTWDSLADFDLTRPGMLDSVDIPTLIVHGRQDPIPLASSEAAARSMRARLVVVEQCGHVPYVEQPQQLFNAIDRFLAGS
ncbi:MAG: alpha/beta hydrolase [Gemmatimonadaceae bacterium]